MKKVARIIQFIGSEDCVDKQVERSIPDGMYKIPGGGRMKIKTIKLERNYRVKSDDMEKMMKKDYNESFTGSEEERDPVEEEKAKLREASVHYRPVDEVEETAKDEGDHYVDEVSREEGHTND